MSSAETPINIDSTDITYVSHEGIVQGVYTLSKELIERMRQLGGNEKGYDTLTALVYGHSYQQFQGEDILDTSIRDCGRSCATCDLRVYCNNELSDGDNLDSEVITVIGTTCLSGLEIQDDSETKTAVTLSHKKNLDGKLIPFNAGCRITMERAAVRLSDLMAAEVAKLEEPVPHKLDDALDL